MILCLSVCTQNYERFVYMMKWFRENLQDGAVIVHKVWNHYNYAALEGV